MAFLAQSHEFSWAEHCPETVEGLSSPEFLIRHGKRYALATASKDRLSFPEFLIAYGKFEEEWGAGFTITKYVAEQISYVYQTLYEERPDFRDIILSLNGKELYKGRDGEFLGGTGDNEIGWHTDDSPPQYMRITKISEDAITVSVSHKK